MIVHDEKFGLHDIQNEEGPGSALHLDQFLGSNAIQNGTGRQHALMRRRENHECMQQVTHGWRKLDPENTEAPDTFMKVTRFATSREYGANVP